MKRKLKRVYHHYSKWEEASSGMWRRPTGNEREFHIQRCRDFMADTRGFRAAMLRAITEWPYSCEHNFTCNAMNRQAWLGHAACCIAIGCPEEPTRSAWWTLTQKQRDDADAAAAEVIELWEQRYTGEDQCQNMGSEQMSLLPQESASPGPSTTSSASM